MQRLVQIGVGLLLVLYPLLVGWSLSHGYWWQVSLLLCVLGLGRLFFSPRKNALFPLTWLAIICGGLSLVFHQQQWIKLYPVAMSLGALSIFAYTLLNPPSMIERFARIFEPDLPSEGVIWTKKVTIVWCIFFILNALIAVLTVFFAPMHIWVLYNGVISYLVMGVLFTGEFFLRKRQQRLHSK